MPKLRQSICYTDRAYQAAAIRGTYGYRSSIIAETLTVTSTIFGLLAAESAKVTSMRKGPEDNGAGTKKW